MTEGFMALQEHAEKIIILVEMMFMGQHDLPCFIEGEKTIKDMKQRFFPNGARMTNAECDKYVSSLIKESYDNWRTRAYDGFQRCCQGIL